MRPLAKIATPAARALLTEATVKFPKRSRKSDGLLPSPAHVKQNPTSDHNDGYGIDLTHDPLNGVDCDDLFGRFRKDKRVQYMIFNRRIWSRAKGERAYDGASPHTSHLHVSLKRDGRAHLDTSPWFPWKQPTTIGKVKAVVQKRAVKK